MVKRLYATPLPPISLIDSSTLICQLTNKYNKFKGLFVYLQIQVLNLNNETFLWDNKFLN